MLPKADPSVIFQKLEEGAVLFAPATELYFGLNDVGAMVWELLVAGVATLELICAQVRSRYPEVSLETIRGDVTELLDQLVREGLARRADSRETDALPHR